MYKKAILLFATFFTSSVHAMEYVAPIGALCTGGPVVFAIKANSPELLQDALEERMGSIKNTFQKELDAENSLYNWKKLQVQGTKGLKRIVSEAADAQKVESEHALRDQELLRNYHEARKRFKNQEVPAYSALATAITPETKSELRANGSVALGVGILSTCYGFESDATLTKLLLIPLGIALCYFGAKKLFDASEYETYVAQQKQANLKVQSILKDRQGNFFEQAIYQLRKIKID